MDNLCQHEPYGSKEFDAVLDDIPVPTSILKTSETTGAEQNIAFTRRIKEQKIVSRAHIDYTQIINQSTLLSPDEL